MFKPTEKSTFKYWFAHWCAYQMTALNLGVWKPHHLLHDVEKPWLLLLWRSYPRVRNWHRKHSSHHIEAFLENRKWNAVDMIIDWECSRFTKLDSPESAYEVYTRVLNEKFTVDNPDLFKKRLQFACIMRDQLYYLNLIN